MYVKVTNRQSYYRFTHRSTPQSRKTCCEELAPHGASCLWWRVCRSQIHGLFCQFGVHQTWRSRIHRTRVHWTQSRIVRHLAALYASIRRLPCKKDMCLLWRSNAFTLVNHTESKPIGCKWGCKTKHYPDGMLRYKARLVVKGYERVKCIGFDETYAPVGSLRPYATCRALWHEIHGMAIISMLSLNSSIPKSARSSMRGYLKALMVVRIAEDWFLLWIRRCMGSCRHQGSGISRSMDSFFPLAFSNYLWTTM